MVHVLALTRRFPERAQSSSITFSIAWRGRWKLSIWFEQQQPIQPRQCCSAVVLNYLLRRGELGLFELHLYRIQSRAEHHHRNRRFQWRPFQNFAERKKFAWINPFSSTNLLGLIGDSCWNAFHYKICIMFVFYEPVERRRTTHATILSHVVFTLDVGKIVRSRAHISNVFIQFLKLKHSLQTSIFIPYLLRYFSSPCLFITQSLKMSGNLKFWKFTIIFEQIAFTRM